MIGNLAGGAGSLAGMYMTGGMSGLAGMGGGMGAGIPMVDSSYYGGGGSGQLPLLPYS
jgi:hypothetical protein